MASCPKCNKDLKNCASWPAWGAELCILVHRALDCNEADDIFVDSSAVKQAKPENYRSIALMSMTLEASLRRKAKKSSNINKKALKQLSNKLAVEMLEGNRSDLVKATLRRKLNIYV